MIGQRDDLFIVIELDELSTFAWFLDTLRTLNHPLDPHLYPKSVGYTAKVSIAVQAVLKLSFAWPAGSRSGKSAHCMFCL